MYKLKIVKDEYGRIIGMQVLRDSVLIGTVLDVPELVFGNIQLASFDITEEQADFLICFHEAIREFLSIIQ